MSDAGRALLDRLLALTPEPPAGADPDALEQACAAMIAARAEVTAAVVPPLVIGDAERPLLVELARRDAAWEAALAAAQRAVGEQRQGAAQLRAYGGAGEPPTRR